MVDESMQIRVFNPNFSGMSMQKLASLIEQADLPSLGYKKIKETKIETDFETGWFLHSELSLESVDTLYECRTKKN